MSHVPASSFLSGRRPAWGRPTCRATSYEVHVVPTDDYRTAAQTSRSGVQVRPHGYLASGPRLLSVLTYGVGSSSLRGSGSLGTGDKANSSGESATVRAAESALTRCFGCRPRVFEPDAPYCDDATHSHLLRAIGTAVQAHR
jgi:hypothetical protein